MNNQLQETSDNLLLDAVYEIVSDLMTSGEAGIEVRRAGRLTVISIAGYRCIYIDRHACGPHQIRLYCLGQLSYVLDLANPGFVEQLKKFLGELVNDRLKWWHELSV